MPGALPPTPGASEGEYDPEDPEPGYVVVQRNRIRADISDGEDGDVPAGVQNHNGRDTDDESA